MNTERTDLPQVWNGIDLNELRHVMDQPADKAVSSVFESKSMDHLRTLLVEMAKNDSSVSLDLPEPMRDFVKTELNFRFSSDDIALFKQTHEIWKAKGMKFVFILFFRALPYTYMAEKPANVLRMTKLLITQPERRIFETAQFVFDVMDHNWWEPDKRGILTALKVRIMHAAMRHVILNNNTGEKWNDQWGKPITQEDLVATNQVFSLEFFKGMEMLGDSLNIEEQRAWFHTWKTIGKIMGVQEELICKDVKDAWSLQHAIYDHLFNDETHSGIPLAKALVETMHHFHLPLKLTLLMMRKMLADEQFPNCFERMLGPTYKSEFPELFVTHETEEDKHQHEELLREHFHTHLREYYHILKDKKTDFQRSKSHEGFLDRIIMWVLVLFGRSSNGKHLFHFHHDILHNILHNSETNEPVEKLEEDMILESMSAMGGIMISVLSLHFREGKQSGFRIPKDLKQHWSMS